MNNSVNTCLIFYIDYTKINKTNRYKIYTGLHQLINNLGYMYLRTHFHKNLFGYNKERGTSNADTFIKYDKVNFYFNKQFDFPFEYDNKFRYVYHVTLKDLWDKKNILIVKSKNIESFYVDRTYLFKEYNENDILSFVKSKYKVFVENKQYKYLDIKK